MVPGKSIVSTATPSNSDSLAPSSTIAVTVAFFESAFASCEQ
jgi:hypothetical protein